jgi:hypothetical protein
MPEGIVVSGVTNPCTRPLLYIVKSPFPPTPFTYQGAALKGLEHPAVTPFGATSIIVLTLLAPAYLTAAP